MASSSLRGAGDDDGLGASWKIGGWDGVFGVWAFGAVFFRLFGWRFRSAAAPGRARAPPHSPGTAHG